MGGIRWYFVWSDCGSPSGGGAVRVTGNFLRLEFADGCYDRASILGCDLAGVGTGDVCLSRSRALTISFNSATSGDTLEVGAFILTLATMALLRKLRTLDLLSMMLEQSAGLLSKNLPPAAEFKES
ncbi:hypothetical protein Tco_0665043 [Tanacetum coccineum]